MVNYIIPFVNTLITIYAIILAVLSINKDWKYYKRNTKQNRDINKKLIKGWIFFGFLSIILIWLNPFVEKKINENLKRRLKPNIDFEIIEQSDSELILSIQSGDSQTIIKTLSLKFNIPGVFKGFNLKKIDRIGKYNIYSSFQVGTGQDTTAEIVYVWFENIQPNSYCNISIYFSPTLPRPIPGSENTKYEKLYMPVMDLHDYSKCIYTWMFQGDETLEVLYKNLSNLSFIKKDNENLLHNFQGIEYENFVRKYNPNYNHHEKYHFTEEWLNKLEEERKDW